jgi:SAM-dependent methyltransferase
MTAAPPVPPCPVTGEPAVRLVQSIKSGFLIRAWRHAFRVNAAPSLKQHPRYHLWESPSGLHFFDPMVEGDHEFYASLYSRLSFMDSWWLDHTRHEFRLAAQHIKAGDHVLDMGCGSAAFRNAIPQASYLGLDPNFAEGRGIDYIRNQTLADHLITNAGQYDVACAFQVLEHLTNPAATFADLVRAVRPGGLVIIGVPHVPSAATRIPNFLINAPPHHLTWWTRSALTALAERNGTSVVAIEQVPWGTQDAFVYWAARFSPIRCKDIYFKNRVSWHLSVLVGIIGARIMHSLRRVPKAQDEGTSLLLVARKI